MLHANYLLPPAKSPMAVDILVVDDSAAIRKTLQRVLPQAEVPIGKVLEVGGGVKALSTLKDTKSA